LLLESGRVLIVLDCGIEVVSVDLDSGFLI
jgi:hypothetical protein